MRQFGELEAVIMDRLWEWGRPALVREMVGDLSQDRTLAPLADRPPPAGPTRLAVDAPLGKRSGVMHIAPQ
jgi:hypothetical protein